MTAWRVVHGAGATVVDAFCYCCCARPVCPARRALPLFVALRAPLLVALLAPPFVRASCDYLGVPRDGLLPALNHLRFIGRGSALCSAQLIVRLRLRALLHSVV